MLANWKTMFGLQNAPFGSHYRAHILNPQLLSYELIDLVWRLSPISLLLESCDAAGGAILCPQYNQCFYHTNFNLSK